MAPLRPSSLLVRLTASNRTNFLRFSDECFPGIGALDGGTKLKFGCWELNNSAKLRTQRMNRLVDLARKYQGAPNLEERMRVAEEIASEVAPRLGAFILSNCRRPDMADDVRQETLVGIVNNLHQFRGATDSMFWSWCYHIARNKISNHLGRRGTRPLVTTDTEDLWEVVEASAQSNPMSAGERLDLEYAMELLRQAKPPCYDYLWQYYIFGWDYDEVALVAGLSHDAARMQIKRCRELAQSLMKEEA